MWSPAEFDAAVRTVHFVLVPGAAVLFVAGSAVAARRRQRGGARRPFRPGPARQLVLRHRAAEHPLAAHVAVVRSARRAVVAVPGRSRRWVVRVWRRAVLAVAVLVDELTVSSRQVTA